MTDNDKPPTGVSPVYEVSSLRELQVLVDGTRNQAGIGFPVRMTTRGYPNTGSSIVLNSWPKVSKEGHCWVDEFLEGSGTVKVERIYSKRTD
jgi:hypothetical protein